MSNIYSRADQLIGKTPLLELTHIEREIGLEARILASRSKFWPSLSILTPQVPSRTALPKP